MIDDVSKFERNISGRDGADGIIEAIFVEIGTTNKYFVEFGSFPCRDNTTHLSKMGWSGLVMDGNGTGVVKKEKITAENINQLFAKYSVPADFDLLSIDIDSNDYWVWKAIVWYRPRVVIIEYNSHIPPNESRSVTYDPNLIWDGSDYYGASLLALADLGTSKGYTLIGCDKIGANAYFVLTELACGKFKGGTVREIYRPPGFRRYTHRRIMPSISV